MQITRKIEVFVCENDKDLRKSYYQKLYDNREVAVKAANLAASHLFVLDNTMPYLSAESKETIEFFGVKGKKGSRQNAPYVAASEIFKDKADMGMISCVLQNVRKMYLSDRKQGMFERSLRSYKGNMPIPYKAERFINLRLDEYVNGEGKKHIGCFFSLMGVPFQMRFGHDRSGNRLIMERIISQKKFDATSGKEGEATGYRMRTSSLAFEKKFDPKKDKKVTKIFLYLCVDISKKRVDVDKKKVIYAYLGINSPIECLIDVKCRDIFSRDDGWVKIGNAEEFLYRRIQIQAALSRCQKNCKYNRGGKGRRRKLQAIELFAKKEKDYVDTKLHLYSRLLVNLAVDHGCGTICLVYQKPREIQAKLDNQKGNPFLLRNWSYFGLKSKIKYKAEMVGIELDDSGKEKGASDEDEEE